MLDNLKLNYKQKANLSDTELPTPRTIVALQKIHKRKIKLTMIKIQLKRNETKEYKVMLTDCHLCTLGNSGNLTQRNSQNGDVRFATQQRNTAAKYEVQKYNLKTSLISNFMYSYTYRGIFALSIVPIWWIDVLVEKKMFRFSVHHCVSAPPLTLDYVLGYIQFFQYWSVN